MKNQDRQLRFQNANQRKQEIQRKQKSILAVSAEATTYSSTYEKSILRKLKKCNEMGYVVHKVS